MKTDSLRAFLDVACRDKRGAYVAKKDLYEVYKLFCDENNIYTVKKGQVTRRLPTIKPKVQLYRPELEGERVRCWKNLEIKKSFIKGKKYVQDVQPLRTTSIACEGKGSNKGSQKRLDISDTEKTSEMVSSSEDLKCCNHRDRQAVAKTEDHYDSNKKVGLCEECLKKSNPDLFLWKSLAEKLEDLGAGVTGSHVSVDTLLRDFECDKTKAQEVIEKQLERGILEENPKNGKIKIRQRR